MSSLKRHRVFVEIPYSPLRETLLSNKSYKADSSLKRKLDLTILDENTRRGPVFAAEKTVEEKPLKKQRVGPPKPSVDVVVKAS